MTREEKWDVVENVCLLIAAVIIIGSFWFAFSELGKQIRW